MQIKKPRSHDPEIHDNTEKDLILVPPSVVEKKINNLEDRSRAVAGFWNGLGIVATLLVAIVASDFKNVLGVSGSTIKGAFITALIAMILKIVYDIYKISTAKFKKAPDVVADLMKDKNTSEGD